MVQTTKKVPCHKKVHKAKVVQTDKTDRQTDRCDQKS